MSLALVTVSGHIRGYDGQPATGSVMFTPTAWKTEPGSDLTYAPEPVPADLLPDGSFNAALSAPTTFDDGDVTYQVDLVVTTGGRNKVTETFQIVMPICDAGSYLDIADRDLTTGTMVVGIAPTPQPVNQFDVWS